MANYLNLPVHRVAGLHRLYGNDGLRFWIGALDLEGGHADRLFYINSSGNIQLINQEVDGNSPVITTSGADFYFIPYRGGKPADVDLSDPEKSYWVMGTNQADEPFCIKLISDLPVVTAMQIGPYESFPLSTGQARLAAVQALAVYGGQVVYGGFRLVSSTDEERYDNFICFSNPDEPHKLAQTGGLLSSIRIGASEAEPVTAMGISTIETDAMGPKGQLCVFTEKQVFVFDGFPPISGNPTGTNFISNSFPFGCNSPRSIVNTPAGLMFFGSDCRFYLIRNGVPTPISTAIDPTFAGMTPRQQKQCAAVWDKNAGYYKFSYPDCTTVVGSSAYRGQRDTNLTALLAHKVVPDTQAWADMRYIGQANDLGVRWYLPMTGMYHSCFASADGAEDRGEIYAGSSIDGCIFEVSLEEYVSDPTPGTPTSTTNITTSGVTGLFDLGDAHIDKTITAMSYGFGCNSAVGLTTSVIVNADNQTMSTQESFSRTVTPSAALLDTTFVLGTSNLSSGDSFEFFTERSGSRMRGKTFRFTFEETSGSARLFFSDISFRAIVAQRRT